MWMAAAVLDLTSSSDPLMSLSHARARRYIALLSDPDGPLAETFKHQAHKNFVDPRQVEEEACTKTCVSMRRHD